ncbi:hypothetical protein SAMN02745121_02292 [Nannocystis exedens]|uniref:Uncharacterized protein n=1 Tax=Nannocystis exedens TaxID=54 RepID=A0A1I1WE69_9BACT|nr:hypothetical protein NAEX_00664 [Nannocystis exedens]SFD93505.1 hypothetical protein SAMN02745121_02292 [Nannocystis exedens]
MSCRASGARGRCEPGDGDLGSGRSATRAKTSRGAQLADKVHVPKNMSVETFSDSRSEREAEAEAEAAREGQRAGGA